MLTDVQCRKAQPREKPYKLADDRGLYLFVTQAGYKSWRWKYRIGNKEKRLIFGPYPEISLSEARSLRDEAARAKRRGIDPAVEKKQRQALLASSGDRSFESVASKWHEARRPAWAPRHAEIVLQSLKREVFPTIGALPIEQVTAPLVLAVLRPIEKRGAVDQAHRIRQRISDVFGFAIAQGLAELDPAAAVRKALPAVVKRNYPAFRRLDQARRAIELTEAAPAHPSTKLASRFMAVTAVRSEPIRHAEPKEFEGLDGPEPIWRIPAVKMKLVLDHKRDAAFEFIVPLSRQAVDVVKAAIEFSAPGPYLFPSQRHAHRPMSENAISSMYRRFPEIRGSHVPHGWRSTFSTIMNERAVAMDRPEDRPIIDLMLAHQAEGVEAIYNRAAYMPRRRQLAQDWADMLLDGFPPARTLLNGPRN